MPRLVGLTCVVGQSNGSFFFYVSVCRVNIDEFTRRVRSSAGHARTGTIVFYVITLARGYHECGRSSSRRRTNETKTKPSCSQTRENVVLPATVPAHDITTLPFPSDTISRPVCGRYPLRGQSYSILTTQTYASGATRTALSHDVVVERSDIKYRCRLISVWFLCFHSVDRWPPTRRNKKTRSFRIL